MKNNKGRKTLEAANSNNSNLNKAKKKQRTINNIMERGTISDIRLNIKRKKLINKLWDSEIWKLGN